MQPEATVYVVDDDAAVRDSLQVLLVALGFRVSAFESAQAFLAHEIAPNACLVTDVRMPGMDGLQLQEEIGRRKVALPVIIMTGHGDVPLAVRAMKAGAVDFLEKPFAEELLLESVRRALEEGSRAAGRTIAAHAAEGRLNQLTARERQVLDLLIAGKANKMIAYELDISPRTVEIHRARVMEKMCARNLADLVRMTLAARNSH